MKSYPLRELMATPAPELAVVALDHSQPVAVRLSALEAVAARLEEISHHWGLFDHGERATLRRAMALDLSAAGFITAA